MTDFYKRLKEYKKINNLTYNDLGEIISVSSDTMRMAINKKSLSDLRKQKFLTVMKNEAITQENSSVYFEKSGIKIDIHEIVNFMILNEKEFMKNKFFSDFIETKVAKKLVKISMNMKSLSEFLGE